MSNSKQYAKDYNPAEMMVCVMNRIMIEDKHTRGGGATFGQIPTLAAKLNQVMHNPDLRLLIGPAGCNRSNFRKLTWYTGDYDLHIGAESRHSMDQTVDNFGDVRGDWGNNWGFMGGFQIDKYGNMNMAYIGKDQKHPKFRGPGTVGLVTTAYRSFSIFTQYHTPRLLVDKVDFISGPGYGDGPGWRERMGCPKGSGPRFCVTPIALFDFDETTKIMRIKSVHPGHTVDEVLNRMSFKPVVPDNVPETEPPTVEEVEIMRSYDPDGILPRLCQA